MLVSILLPVFNASRHLPLALASLQLQSHDDLEIIAIDDGSTDDSAAILRRAAASDSRIRVVQRENRGLIATLNEGLDLARGDFIARMDADDIAYRDRISTQLAAFAAEPGLAMCGTHFDTIVPRGAALPPNTPDVTESLELRVLSRFCTILRHPTVMFRRSAIPEGVLRYDPAYPCAEDFDLFRRIAELCPVRQLDTPLLAYRLHAESVSVTRAATLRATHVRILEENFLRHYPEAAGTGFTSLVSEVTPEAIAAAAELVHRLDALLPQQPPEERRAFSLGQRVTLYFLYAWLVDLQEFAAARDFVEASGKQALFRRTERAVLGLAGSQPTLARGLWAALVARGEILGAFHNRKLASVVPDLDAIQRQAETLTTGVPPAVTSEGA
ncbi:glycosyltransferase family 2 protein [Tropicimonas sediminicola]|uniref:Glycosyltransferase involved in cell wall bisynthesis n=1 Tax=Tropicimonas sediminicola TaxID=1031541 RepID=A0A239CD87_9RHOB|nr:glycosyltransferase family A protein [Tropicimonas sediminicola]SNS17611.1 Glycosyltransferase involved in cell wall bisynthesis [Tropicimonas sediminicola]